MRNCWRGATPWQEPCECCSTTRRTCWATPLGVWVRLQPAYDMWHAEREEDVSGIPTLPCALLSRKKIMKWRATVDEDGS